MPRKYRPIPQLTQEEINLFWSYVEKTPTCWLWRGAVTGSGYGAIKIRGRMISVHRLAFYLLNGTIDSTQVIRHGDCCEKLCVRHLSQGSHKDNMHDEIERGLTCKGDRWHAAHQNQARGERVGNSKLTEPIVREMRALYIPRKVGYAKVAQLIEAKYGIKIDPTLVYQVIKRKWWAWVE